MSFLALFTALAALGVSVAALARSFDLAHALVKEKEQKAQLKETLVSVLDEDGNIRGQLRLPGQPLGDEMHERLALAERSVSSIHEEVERASHELREAAAELETARLRELELQKTFVEAVDKDGNVLVKLRLPGKSPVTTPCGEMCSLAEMKDKAALDTVTGTWARAGCWTCRAGQGRPCDHVRPQFEDEDGQCVLFQFNHNLA